MYPVILPAYEHITLPVFAVKESTSCDKAFKLWRSEAGLEPITMFEESLIVYSRTK
jgi:hypothetical protein